MPGGFEVVEHFEADEAGFAEVGVGKPDGFEAGFEFANGGEQVVPRLVVRREGSIQREIHAVGALIWGGVGVDGDVDAGDFVLDGFGEVADLVVPGVGSNVDDEEGPASSEFAGNSPFHGQSHVVGVDERPPRGAIAQDSDFFGGESAGDEVVEDEVEAEPGAHAAGGREAQAGDFKGGIRKGLEVDFGGDLGAGVGREGVEGGRFGAGAVFSEAIDAATGGKDEGGSAGAFGLFGDGDAGLVVDLEGDVLEGLAHRVVRDGSQMDDGGDSRKDVVGNVSHVAEVLCVELVFGEEERRGGTVSEKAAIEAQEGRVGESAAEMADNVRSDVAHVAGDQNFGVSHGERSGDYREELGMGKLGVGFTPTLRCAGPRGCEGGPRRGLQMGAPKGGEMGDGRWVRGGGRWRGGDLRLRWGRVALWLWGGVGTFSRVYRRASSNEWGAEVAHRIPAVLGGAQDQSRPSSEGAPGVERDRGSAAREDDFHACALLSPI
jgi:hypothetical protein